MAEKQFLLFRLQYFVYPFISVAGYVVWLCNLATMTGDTRNNNKYTSLWLDVFWKNTQQLYSRVTWQSIFNFLIKWTSLHPTSSIYDKNLL